MNLRIAIIGLGDIAQKAYLPLLTAWEGVEPMFCTRKPEVLARLRATEVFADVCLEFRDGHSRHGSPFIGTDQVISDNVNRSERIDNTVLFIERDSDRLFIIA